MVNGEHEANGSDFWMASGLYDALKFCALILFPAFGALYFSLAGIWNLPNAEQVVGTVAIVDTFLGTVLKFSKSSYDKSNAAYDGVIDVVPDDGGVGLSMQLLHIQDPLEVQDMKKVVFKVNKRV